MTENTVQRNDSYYLNTVIFQVENRLFKLPKYGFCNNSSYFKQKLSAADATLQNGMSDADPIVLEGITCAEFECFLKVLYPLDCKSSKEEMSVQDLTSVLRLSTLWSFPEIRQLSTEKMNTHLSSMSPVDKVLLARRLRISSSFLHACEELVKRKERISEDEAQRLGVMTTARLCQERERCREEHNPSQRSTSGRFSSADFISRGARSNLPSARHHSCGMSSLAHAQPSSSSAFGLSTQPPSLFGQPLLPYTTQPSSSTTGLFFGPGSIYGSSAPAQPSSSVFGSSTVTQPQPSSYIYGSVQSSTPTQPLGTTTGLSAQSQPSGPLFGSSTQTHLGSLFGLSTHPQPRSPTAGPTSEPPPSGSLSGSSAQTHRPVFGIIPTQPPVGSTTGLPAQSQPSGSLFGSSNPSATFGSSTQPLPQSSIYQRSTTASSACSHLISLRRLFHAELEEMENVEEK